MDSLSSSEKRHLPMILAVAIFMQMLDTTILNTALPSIAADLHASPLNMQMTVISYALTLALMIPLSGYFADRFGTKTTFQSALILFCIGSLLCALSTSLSMLIFSRVIQGVGGAMMVPVARLTVMKAFDKSEWVEALNVAIVPALIAPIIAPLLGGYLTQWLSWHWIFLINIPIGILGILFTLRVMPNFHTEVGKMDLMGYGIFASAAFLLTLGLDWLGQGGGVIFVLMIITGFVLLRFYIHHAQRHREAIFPIDLFSVRTFRVGLMGNLFSRIGMSSLPFLLPLLFQVAFGYSASVSGWMLIPIALSSILAKPLMMPMIHRFGYRKVLLVNTAIVGLNLMAFAIPSAHVHLLWFLPILMFTGLTNSLQFSTMNTITLANLRIQQNSSGNSLMSVNQQLSMSFGLAIGASILQLSMKQDWLTHGSIHAAFQITFIILGLITLSSAWIFSLLHPQDGDQLAHRSHGTSHQS
ncbi:MAG: DHA2 family efflux MFS transporter permease subunit [Neisseriaceae bacterium]|nr:DHA2 family efflux MFS transporter permease subunit [Neisseriaceae bacterium]